MGIQNLRKSELDFPKSYNQRKTALDIISVDGRKAKGSVVDQTKTPGKFKKSTYLNSVKKGGNV